MTPGEGGSSDTGTAGTIYLAEADEVGRFAQSARAGTATWLEAFGAALTPIEPHRLDLDRLNLQ